LRAVNVTTPQRTFCSVSPG